MDNVLLQELLFANDPEEKAAIVAESIFAKLPRETSLVARRCSILHWFNEIIIEALLKDRPYIEGQFRGIYDQIKALPFLEVLPWGLTFNSLTREGLLRRYTITQPDMLRMAAQLAALSYKALGEDEKIAAEAFFCYIIAGETTLALELLNELMRKAYANENWEYMSGLIQLAHEANQFSFVNPLPLSEILERYSETLSHETNVKVRGTAWDQRADSDRGSILVNTALEPYASHLKFDSFSNSPTDAQYEQDFLAQSMMHNDPTLDKQRLQRRTPEGRYEISDIDLVLNIRTRKAEGNTGGMRMLLEALLERCAPEFQRQTHGLRHRPELREEAIANMNEHLLREAMDPTEIFMTQNFIHYLRCLCADEFSRVLRQEGLHYRRDKEGRPSGRPQHVPRALIEPLHPTFVNDESVPETDLIASDEKHEKLLAKEESQRILSYLSDPLDRQIMVLRVIENMKWDDIAVICKRTERTVRLRFERARSYLNECINKEYTYWESLIQQQKKR